MFLGPTQFLGFERHDSCNLNGSVKSILFIFYMFYLYMYMCVYIFTYIERWGNMQEFFVLFLQFFYRLETIKKKKA